MYNQTRDTVSIASPPVHQANFGGESRSTIRVTIKNFVSKPSFVHPTNPYSILSCLTVFRRAGRCDISKKLCILIGFRACPCECPSDFSSDFASDQNRQTRVHMVRRDVRRGFRRPIDSSKGHTWRYQKNKFSNFFIQRSYHVTILHSKRTSSPNSKPTIFKYQRIIKAR